MRFLGLLLIPFMVKAAINVTTAPRNVTNQRELAVQRPVSIGVHPGWTSIQSREQDYGVKIDRIMLFQNIKSLNYDWVKPYLNSGKKVTLVLEFFADYPNLEAISNGAWNYDIERIARAVKADGRQITIRPLHEINGDWYSWGVYRNGNSAEKGKRAFQHIVNKFRWAGAWNAKFQFGLNVKSPRDSPTPFRDFYPGDSFVDSVAISCYNMAGLNGKPWMQLADLFRPAYNQVRGFTWKPIALGETSSASWGGNKAEWIKKAFNSLTYEFQSVQEVDFFLENKELPYDLNSQSEEDAFAQAIRDMRWATGNSWAGDTNDQPEFDINTPEIPPLPKTKQENKWEREAAKLKAASLK